MRPLTALIADDEPLARRRIRTLLERETDVSVVGETGDGKATIEAIRSRRPDVVFLDIRMPGLDGFEVIETVGAERMPAVVIVTAFDRHAVRAFEKHAADYLVKPFDDERFADALRHVRSRVRAGAAGSPTRLLRTLESLEARQGWLRRLIVRTEGRLVVVRVEDVDWLWAEGNYVRVYAGGTAHRMRTTLHALSGRLDPERFLRINRSQLVCADRVRELQPAFHGEYFVILQDGTRLVASRRCRDRVIERLGAIG